MKEDSVGPRGRRVRSQPPKALAVGFDDLGYSKNDLKNITMATTFERISGFTVFLLFMLEQPSGTKDLARSPFLHTFRSLEVLSGVSETA